MGGGTDTTHHKAVTASSLEGAVGGSQKGARTANDLDKTVALLGMSG